MLKSPSLTCLAVVCTLALAPCLPAATYYIDFQGGSDTASGTSPTEPWKHSPGDSNATGNPAAAKLAPGDTVIFKGGVAYHGSLIITASGEAGKPITLDGNSEGKFGEGRAVLDGGSVIQSWQPAKNAAEAGGNPRWADIYIADIDADLTSNFEHGEFIVHRQQPRDRQAPWQRLILCDGDRGLLPISQIPKPSDDFYPDLPKDFLESETKLEVLKGEGVTKLVDEKNLGRQPATFFDGMFIGVHGGNNHVYFAPVKGYDAKAKMLTLPEFKHSLYAKTKYALYNSPRLIENPGEWSATPIDGGKVRIHLLPMGKKGEQPTNIGYPVMETGVEIQEGASHIGVRGFLIQRYSGGAGGVSVARSTKRSSNIAISDCEIRFVAGHAGVGLNYCDEITVENCHIYLNPAWTTAIFVSRVNNFVVRKNRLNKNSGSGIRHYEAKDGVLEDNAILNHFGMHSSAINVYEGCRNLVLERNYIQNVATMNRSAENIVFRNNVIDSMGRNGVAMAIWGSGTVGGREIKDIQFLNNTFVNVSQESNWGAGIFAQAAKGAGQPEGVVVRGNVLDRIGGNMSGEFDGNIYLRDSGDKFSEGNKVVSDMKSLFIAPDKGDFRRRPGSALPEAGASIAPPDDISEPR